MIAKKMHLQTIGGKNTHDVPKNIAELMFNEPRLTSLSITLFKNDQD